MIHGEKAAMLVGNHRRVWWIKGLKQEFEFHSLAIMQLGGQLAIMQAYHERFGKCYSAARTPATFAVLSFSTRNV